MEGKQPEKSRRPLAGARAAEWAGMGPAGGLDRARLSVWREAWLERLRAAFALEGERRVWFNFLPVAFGVGVGLYFLADREPLWWGPPLALALLAAGAFAARAKPVPLAILLALSAAAAGMIAAKARTDRVAAPILERTTIGPLQGFVESLEERTGDMRVVIAVTGFAGLPDERRPARVRLTARKAALAPGEHVAVTARLTPPPEPARPGGYDFARDSFYRGIGAVGSALGTLEIAPAAGPAPLRLRLMAGIDAARNTLTARIAGLIGGQAGAVAAAMVTGKRGLISEETNDALRAAGLYHIVSISGLHMVLAAGTIFWIVRALLALSAAIALAWPVKKIAAVAAMAGAGAYCLFSGSEVATVRSLIMTLVMLGAILADRPALSMRNLAIAALIVLALEPDSLLGPSFQMSFGAVAALIAFAEWSRSRQRADRPPEGAVGRVATFLARATAGLFVTSVLATAATSPFGAYHFQTYNPFGLIGNMLALPFVSLGVMPAAVIGALLYPLGLDAAAWWVMGVATEPVLWVSRQVEGFGGSTQVLPAFGPPAVSLLGTALVLATMLTTWLRFAAIAPLAAGLALAAQSERADVFVDREGMGVAVRAPGGQLAIMGRPGNFVAEQWLKADGDGRKPDDPATRRDAACDPSGCVATLASGQTIAWSRRAQTVAEDCGRATLVVTPLTWRGACAALMIDRTTLDRHGAISIRVTPDGLAARTARDPGVTRPWLRPAPPAPDRPATSGPTAPVAPDEAVSSDASD